jgi:hypothetical protein
MNPPPRRRTSVAWRAMLSGRLLMAMAHARATARSLGGAEPALYAEPRHQSCQPRHHLPRPSRAAPAQIGRSKAVHSAGSRRIQRKLGRTARPARDLIAFRARAPATAPAEGLATRPHPDREARQEAARAEAPEAPAPKTRPTAVWETQPARARAARPDRARRPDRAHRLVRARRPARAHPALARHLVQALRLAPVHPQGPEQAHPECVGGAWKRAAWGHRGPVAPTW